ncbi:MAG TPA: hypothetical protein VFY07_06340, partial [Geomobilimonas sp.]|nr:hypothetical protein [Geomobilimonas sp.]
MGVDVAPRLVAVGVTVDDAGRQAGVDVVVVAVVVAVAVGVLERLVDVRVLVARGGQRDDAGGHEEAD